MSKNNSTTTTPTGSGLSVSAQLRAVLTKTIADITVLEVRTYTRDVDTVPPEDAPTTGAQLRAFTSIALDGDTQVCVPLGASGEPEAWLWTLHKEVLAQARADRAATLELAMTLASSLGGR